MRQLPRKVRRYGAIKLCISLSALLSVCRPSLATHLQAAESLQVEKQKKAEQSQQRVEKLDDQTQRMLDEFREASLELQNIRTYHNQLAKIVQSQEEEKNELGRQMLDLEITQRNITPLMLRMLEVFEQFVDLDSPFLQQERKLRVAHLKEMMDRSDVTLGEKFRNLLEAYMVETEYGRTIESYSADLKRGDGNQTVDFLRLGRTELYYLTLDESEAGYWNKRERRWQVLEDRYRSAILQGIRIAKKQAAPDLLQLPVDAPEAMQ